MKTTIDKIITVATNLTTKYKKIDLDISNITLSQIEISEFNTKFTNILNLLDENESSSNNHDYIYTASGFAAEYTDINGNYWEIEQTYSGNSIYTNGKIYLLHGDLMGFGTNDFWGFSTTTNSADILCLATAANVISATWYGGANFGIQCVGAIITLYK